MPTNIICLEEPLAFYIDQEAAAHINRFGFKVLSVSAKDIGETAYETMKHPDFSKFICDPSSKEYQALKTAGFFDVFNAMETLGHITKNNWVHSDKFTGIVRYLNNNGEPTGQTEELENGNILFIRSSRKSTPFRAAYSCMNDFIQEIKDSLAWLNIFPADFDYQKHIVSISGTYSNR